MRNSVLTLVFLVTVFLSMWVVDVYQDRHYQVSVTQTTSLYNSETDAAYANSLSGPKPNSIGNLLPGEKVIVKRATYGKDYWALEIETVNGTVGWVAAGQDGINIDKP